MSQANVDLVAMSVEAFNRHDVSDLAPFIGEDAEIIVMRTLLDGTEYRGVEGLNQFVADYVREWDDLHIEVEELRDCGDSVLMLGRFQAKVPSGGFDIDMEGSWVLDFRDGKMTRLQAYPERADALEVVAGLSANS